MGINLKGKLFKDVYPEGAAMLKPELNQDVDIDTLSAGSEKECVFQCLSNSKHIFKKKVCKMISYRDGRGVGCKFCGPNRSEAFPGETDFFTVVPKAREMWDSDAEENKKLDPSKLFPASNKYAIFKCKNGHRERRKILDFTKAPYCQSCKNYYVNQDPMLRTFWDEERNRRDFVNDCICPYCNEKKVLPGFNSFAAKHPDEMEEWDELANYLLADPDEILSSYNQKLWWNCTQGHKYDMSPKQKLYYRMRKMQPCPYCKGRRRKLHHFF